MSQSAHAATSNSRETSFIDTRRMSNESDSQAEVGVRVEDGSGDGNRARLRRSRPDAPSEEDRSSRNRNEEEENEEEELTYGAGHVIKIFIPVTLCMLVVIATISSVNYYTDQSSGTYLIYTPFHPKATDTVGDTTWKTITNALIVLGVVVVMTIVLVLLYKYRCYKIIHGWLMVSTVLLVFLFSYLYAEAVLKAYNVPFDYLSIAIFIWNFGCMGMISLHWKAPLHVQQAYHIVISALLSLVFIKYLPEWTLWMVLAVIAVWDLVAVLCPKGPLNVLVTIAHERNENIFPSLIYSSTVVYAITSVVTAAATSSTEDSEEETTSSRPLRNSSAWTSRDRYGGTNRNEGAESQGTGSQQAANQQQELEEDEDKGVKLGLGDFIFYSVLVGKASSSGQWTTTIAAFIAILMGLFFTLILLAVFKKALPALPISIFFGLVFNFATRYCITPLVDGFASQQIFI